MSALAINLMTILVVISLVPKLEVEKRVLDKLFELKLLLWKSKL